MTKDIQLRTHHCWCKFDSHNWWQSASETFISSQLEGFWQIDFDAAGTALIVAMEALICLSQIRTQRATEKTKDFFQV